MIYMVLINKATVNRTNSVGFVLITYTMYVTGSPEYKSVCSYLLHTDENTFSENLLLEIETPCTRVWLYGT